jgi:hypothetical protein
MGAQHSQDGRGRTGAGLGICEEDGESDRQHQSPFTWKPDRKTISIEIPVGISMTG